MHHRIAHRITLQQNTAIVLLVAGAVMISFSGVWVKISHVTPTVSALYRALFGGIFLLIAAGWRREISWKGWYRLMLGLLCGIFLALDLCFWHQSIHYIGPGLATILAFIWDVLIFQRETSTINWIGVIIAISAIYLGTVKKSDNSQ